MNEVDAIDYHARNNNIPVELVRSIIKVVSEGNPRKKLNGKYGLMQLELEGEVTDEKIEKLLDPVNNVSLGCLRLRSLREKICYTPNSYDNLIREAYPDSWNKIMIDFESKCKYITQYKYIGDLTHG